MHRKDRKGDRHQSPLAEPNSHPQNARTGKALANLRVIVSLFGGGTHEFIEHAGRHIEKLIEKSIVKRSAFRHRGRGRKFVSAIIVRATRPVSESLRGQVIDFKAENGDGEVSFPAHRMLSALLETVLERNVRSVVQIDPENVDCVRLVQLSI